MAQGRMLSQTIAEDEELNRCSEEAALLYVHTLPHLDRDGLITGRPILLWRLALPLRARFMDIAGQLIEEWVQQGLVIRFAGAKGEPVLFFKGFRKNNQNLAYEFEKPSRYPPPPGWQRTAQGLVPEDPQVRLGMADGFDPRSKYYKALLDPASVNAIAAQQQTAKSRQKLNGQTLDRDRDLLASGSGGDPDLIGTKDQDQSMNDGDDHHSCAPPVVREGGGVQGGMLADLLAGFADEQLRLAAWELGALVEFQTAWTDYLAFVERMDRSMLVRLLGWIQHYHDQPQQTLQIIHSLPALVRSHLQPKDGSPARNPVLQQPQQRSLVTAVELILRAGEVLTAESDSARLRPDGPQLARAGVGAETAAAIAATLESELIAKEQPAGRTVDASVQEEHQAAWAALLAELALQMPSATYNTWVRDTWLLAIRDGTWVIGVPNPYARDWLISRLRFKLKRVLASMGQRVVDVEFESASQGVT